MHKAYDRVEWCFLQNMTTDAFIPTRGIQKGDPLSPYILPIHVLALCRGLSSCLLHEEEVGGIEGVKVCRNAPSVPHLLFTDDSLILLKEDLHNATLIAASS